MRAAALNSWLASVCLLIPLGCESPSPANGDGAGETETGETEAGETETEAGETEAGETETGDEPYGHGNLHPDCMGDAPIVALETTLGTMVVQLDSTRAPITVANFLGYVSSEFYDNTIFHRVIEGFVIQGGGYEPGLELKQTLGTIPLEIDPALIHVDGAIAMARSQAPDTAESQWYITDKAQPGLDGNYAVFGVLIDGFDVRDAIAAVATADAMWMGFTMSNVPVEDVIVTAAVCVPSWP